MKPTPSPPAAPKCSTPTRFLSLRKTKWLFGFATHSIRRHAALELAREKFRGDPFRFFLGPLYREVQHERTRRSRNFSQAGRPKRSVHCRNAASRRPGHPGFTVTALRQREKASSGCPRRHWHRRPAPSKAARRPSLV